MTGARPVHDDDFGELDHEPEYDDDCDDGECWNCGGEGFYADCDEEWACADPEGGCDLCIRRCNVCNPRKPKPEEGVADLVASDGEASNEAQPRHATEHKDHPPNPNRGAE